MGSAVAPGWKGAVGAVSPLATACVPRFDLLKTLFGASRNMTSGNNGKRNNNVQR